MAATTVNLRIPPATLAQWEHNRATRLNWYVAMQWIDARLELRRLTGTATEVESEFQKHTRSDPSCQSDGFVFSPVLPALIGEQL